jgi:hypothetical protein
MPFILATTVGGWQVRRSVAAYLSLAGVVLLPSFRLDAFGFFMIILLFSFGRRYYVDSMIRLHILLRLRSGPLTVTELEAEPLLALHAFLRDATGGRNFERYTRLAGKLAFLRDAFYYPSLGCIALFLGAFGSIFTSVWEPALRAFDGAMVTLADIGVWGAVVGMIALFTISVFGTWMLESRKPVFVEARELSSGEREGSHSS